jgi:agmatinase
MSDLKILSSAGLFGVEVSRTQAHVVLQQVPWEVTTSYGSGTSLGPKAILEASPQLDLFDIEFGEAYQAGFFLQDADPQIRDANLSLKPVAQQIIAEWEEAGELSANTRKLVDEVNAGSAKMVSKVYEDAVKILKEGKIPGLIGGDHSTPLGAIKAVCEKYEGKVGVLHVDAHADLRLAYQDFQHSHASIMRNVCALKVPPEKLVQVGIRDFCKEEYDFIQETPRMKTYFDRPVKARLLKGESWGSICDEIIKNLPQNVYVSFDIDGLSPEFCPSTGTPVPGGLSFDEAVHLLGALGRSGRKIVGFDLNEVAPNPDGGEWDGNVGARILFKMCGWAAVTNGLAKTL